ncbi:hypothetical protein BR93DRAFT_574103 [Coniochaeta sp. PMI_546]|nr:hypothetical protein BR93DRAFT_574103 [Coniochaeta sp. PMI_546]
MPRCRQMKRTRPPDQPHMVLNDPRMEVGVQTSGPCPSDNERQEKQVRPTISSTRIGHQAHHSASRVVCSLLRGTISRAPSATSVRCCCSPHTQSHIPAHIGLINGRLYHLLPDRVLYLGLQLQIPCGGGQKLMCGLCWSLLRNADASLTAQHGGPIIKEEISIHSSLRSGMRSKGMC